LLQKYVNVQIVLTFKHYCKYLEFGTNFSTILDDGHPMLPKDPLDADSEWVCEKTGGWPVFKLVKVQEGRLWLGLLEDRCVSLLKLGWLRKNMDSLTLTKYSMYKDREAYSTLTGSVQRQ